MCNNAFRTAKRNRNRTVGHNSIDDVNNPLDPGNMLQLFGEYRISNDRIYKIYINISYNK